MNPDLWRLLICPVFHSKLNPCGVTSLAGEAPLFSLPVTGRALPEHSKPLFKPRACCLRSNQAQKRVSAWTSPSVCPFDAEAARLLVGPVGRDLGGCWECSQSEVPVRQRSPSSFPPRVSPSRFWPTSLTNRFSSSVVTPSPSPLAQPARFSSSLWRGCNYLNCSL